MAKFNEREGNSCHIHISLRGDGRLARCSPIRRRPHGMSAMFRSFIAGQLATLRELTLFYAPNINSYKRFVDGSFAPDRGRVGHGQPHLRAARGRPRPRHAGGEPGARRRRQPVPGRRRADRGRPARHRAASSNCRSALRGQRLHQWRAAAADHAARGRRRCSTGRRSPARRSATRSSSTTSTTRASNWPRSTPPSPTGRGCAALNGSELASRAAHRPVDRPDHLSASRRRPGSGTCGAASCPRSTSRASTCAGGIAVLLPPQPVDAGIAARVLDGLDGLIITGGTRRRPGPLRPAARIPPPTSPRTATATPGSSRCCAARCDAATAGARHLPRRAGAQRRARRHAAPAPARRRRPHPPSAGQRGVQHVGGAHGARHPAGRADRRDRRTRSATTTRRSTGSATA